MKDVRRSPEAKALLSSVVLDPVYRKWRGTHWVLADLADIGYPPRAKELKPLIDLVVDRWLGPQFYREEGHGAVPLIAGRYRRCGSQQGNALRTMLKLGLADDRAHQLAERLMHWQWPDGGWNCDRHRSADTSSFMETLLPMRGLGAYAEWSGEKSAAAAARQAAEVFLSRKLFLRRRDGKPMSSDFMRLHYPLYWHYDFLGGLVGMKELGLIGDPRCEPAMELLESKRLPDRGWPAEAKWYKVSEGPGPGISAVDWGGVNQRASNPWVTRDALSVMAATV